jgi:ABC-type glycerol-3-phosphate transport system substrate-binding protein
LLATILTSLFCLALWLWWRLLPGRQIYPEIRPEKKYSVVLWDFDRPLAGHESYREELLSEIQAFNRDFPNIEVDVKLFPWDQGEQVATAILRRQDVPDVLSSGPIENLDFGRRVLLSPQHLTEESRLGYVPLAMSALEQGGEYAFWPRYIKPQLYLANTNLLQIAGVELSTLEQYGLGWADMLELGQKLSQLPARPFVLASFDYEGLLTAVAPREVEEASAASSNWPQKAAVTAAARLKQLQDRGFLPPNASQDNYSGVREFFAGQAALLAPAEPWLIRAVEGRSDRIERGLLDPGENRPFPTALIAPKLDPTSGLPAQVEVLVVFRRRRAADEIRAAVELAQHLSRSGTLSAKLDLLPAYGPSQDTWCEAWELGNEATLLQVCEHGRIVSPYPNTGLEGKDVLGRIK